MAGGSEEKSRSVSNNTAALFGPFSRPDPSEILRRPPGLDTSVTIGGQRYQQKDNGRANVLVPYAGPLASLAQQAENRAALERALYMANSPLAGAAYGIAAAAGASPQGRDKAMALGGVVDTVMLGAAPFGARVRIPIQPPPTQPPLPTLPRAPIRYGLTSATNQTSGGDFTITQPMLRTGKRVNPRLKLPGLVDSEEQDRGHVLAKGLGGMGDRPEEAMALYQYPNRSPMQTFEKSIIDRVDAGETVEYFVKPLYSSPGSAPSWVVLSAEGSRGGFTPRIVRNVPGPRR